MLKEIRENFEDAQCLLDTLEYFVYETDEQAYRISLDDVIVNVDILKMRHERFLDYFLRDMKITARLTFADNMVREHLSEDAILEAIDTLQEEGFANVRRRHNTLRG